VVLRLFVPSAQREGDRVRITGAELRHLRTLRLEEGARLVLFDERGDEHDVVLERLGSRAADAAILATGRPAREPGLDLTLAPALLKGDRMDLVIEKATELGVRRIAPVASRHVVGRGARTERWRRIAVAATKQSGRTVVPTVDAPRSFADVVRAPWPGLRLLAWEGERSHGFHALAATAAAVVMLVGPEGGFADDEVGEARDHDFTTVTLAPRVLRAETAAIVAATLCLARWGDLGGPLSTPGALR
jgi:16S rRNA (uracil1498-N3)-methyltransferase